MEKGKRRLGLIISACMVFALTLLLQGLPVKAVGANEGNYSWDVTGGVLEITANVENVWVYKVNEKDYPWHNYRDSIKTIRLVATGNNSFSTLGEFCFADCTNLETVVFPTGNKSPGLLGEGVFKGCTGLKQITIPDTVTNIGRSSFESSGLTSFTWPRNIHYVYPNTFKDCKSLESVDFSNFTATFSDTSIDQQAFSGCTALTSVSIPEGIKYVSDEAFLGCTKLKAVSFPSTLVEIKSGAFQNCISLESVDLTKSYQKNFEIWQYAFKDCTSLKRVKLGSNVTMLGAFCFQNCKALESINLPDSLTTLGGFDGCNSLTELVVPASVTQLSFDSDPNKIYHSITNCKNLQAVVIPASVTKILPGFLAGCPRAVIVTTAPSVAYQYAKENGIPVMPLNGGRGDCGTNLYWYFDEAKGDLVIGGSGAMKDFDRNEDPAPWSVKYATRLDKVKTITIESGVTYIGKDAFANLSAAQTLSPLPASVEKIGEGAFRGCTGLLEVTIPATVETIEKDAFKGDSNLSIVTTDGSAAADYASANGMKCQAKTSAQVKAEAEQKAKENKDGKTSKDGGGESATFTVGGLQYEISDAGDKKEVTLTGITSKKKTAVSIPAKVTYNKEKYDVTAIGEKAFFNCRKLKKITIKTKKLKSVGKNAFKKIHKNAVISVPKAKLKAYKKLLKGKGQAKTVKIK